MQTVSTMLTCILGLLEHPEVVKKAQAQIDAVVQPGHLPDLDDQESLPYISAIVSEALRWRDVTPIGLLFLCYITTAILLPPPPSDSAFSIR